MAYYVIQLGTQITAMTASQHLTCFPMQKKLTQECGYMPASPMQEISLFFPQTLTHTMLA